MTRKTPIRLFPGSLSDRVFVWTRYTVNDEGLFKAASDGKHDVTADFDALFLATVLDPDSHDLTGALDGVARGMELNDEERAQVAAFRERLVAVIERHNAHLADSSQED